MKLKLSSKTKKGPANESPDDLYHFSFSFFFFFFIKKSTISPPAIFSYILFPPPVFSWLKKKNRTIRHPSQWKMTKETVSARLVNRQGQKSLPLPLPRHPFSLRKSKGRVIVRLIPQDKSLSDFRNPSN